LVKKYLHKIKIDAPITEINQKNLPQKKYIKVTDRNLTYMAILMCIASAFENFFYAGSEIYYKISINDISTSIFFAYFILTIKKCLNFLAFFLFYK
jgi:hypothetical protein